MNGFDSFDDFRVGAWVTKGVIHTMAEAEKTFRTIVKKAGAAIAGAVVAASIVSVPATAATTPVKPATEHVVSSTGASELKAEALLELELDNFAAQMTAALSRLEEADTISVDSDLMVLAQSALIASDNRQDYSPMEIAEAFFANGR